MNHEGGLGFAVLQLGLRRAVPLFLTKNIIGNGFCGRLAI
jgi:hypothetical protein